MLYEGCPLYFTLIFKVRGIFGAKFLNTSPFSVIGAILRQDPYIGGSTGKEASQAFLLKWQAILFGKF